MKRTRAQQPKLQDPQDAAANPKPQRRAKQPRQPKAAAAGARKTTEAEAAALAAVAAANAATAGAGAGAASPGPAESPAPVVPDVCGAGEGEATDRHHQHQHHSPVPHGLDWDLVDAGLAGDAAWWTWGVEEEKLLGWFPFVEEDFRCGGGARGGDAEAAAFDDDIWRIHQIYEIPSHAAK